MSKALFKVFSTFMFAILVAITPISIPHAEANVAQSDINEQRLVVKAQLIDTMREHVNLLRLVLIKRLEDRVTYLQTLVEAQK